MARKEILSIADDRETATLIAEEFVDRGFEVNIISKVWKAWL
jgi:hypothetical protein